MANESRYGQPTAKRTRARPWGPARRYTIPAQGDVMKRCRVALLVALAAVPAPTRAAQDPKVARMIHEVDAVAARGPFAPNWASLARFKTPEWYQDAKFGIFIHWGVYSVPAFGNEWYPRNMYLQGTPEFEHHVATYGPQAKFGYKDFIPQFKAEKFDARRLGGALQGAPARSSSCRWPSTTTASPCTTAPSPTGRAAKMGPKRDVIGELAQAVRAEGLVFGVSTHRAEHWWFFDGGMKFDSDVQGPALRRPLRPGAQPQKTADEQERARPTRRSSTTGWPAPCELVDKYQPAARLVRLVDRAAAPSQPYLQTLRRLLLQPRRASGARASPSTTRTGAFPDRAAVLDIERGQLAGIRPLLLADRHLGLEELLGLRREAGLQDAPTRSSATWSTSSARTARCC